MQFKQGGVYVALLTPMHADGSVDRDELGLQVLRMARERGGADAIAVITPYFT